jgi:hypothetical protein
MRRTLVPLLAIFVLASCGDSKPAPKYDLGPKKDGITVDQAPIPDYPTKDQYKWPDHSKIDQPTPREAYVGSPFGCQLDADCFGQKCCPTPWGVKLCSPSCDLK